MGDLLDVICRYRLLTARCRAGAELSMEEIQFLSRAERDLTAHRVAGRALLRGADLNDWVDVALASPAGLLCQSAPPATIGQTLDVRLEDERRHRSYLLKTRVVAAVPGESGWRLELAFTGAPLLLRNNPTGDRIPEVIQQFAA